MCLPPINKPVHDYFSLIKKKNDELKFKDLSLGMSNDYIEALIFKTSFIRIGTKNIWRKRLNYFCFFSD